MKAPSFWSHRGLLSTALLPLAYLYQAASYWRTTQTRKYHSHKTVICVGNLTSGGTGKTPICLAITDILKQRGLRPVILSRGYGGSLKGPILLDTRLHTAKQSGDEPRLLAQKAPVVIAANRADGARFIEQTIECDVIIMDDGLQNPQLAKDMTICVFDGEIGIQNGRLFPAGPLRTNIKSGKQIVDIILINGTDKQNIQQKMAPLLCLGFRLSPQNTDISKSKKHLAFAGIGRPVRFFNMLAEQGFHLVDAQEFGDHHLYSDDELQRLLDQARRQKANLITTEKDWVRLSPSWQKLIDYYPVHLTMADDDKQKLNAQIFAKLKS